MRFNDDDDSEKSEELKKKTQANNIAFNVHCRRFSCGNMPVFARPSESVKCHVDGDPLMPKCFSRVLIVR